MEQKNRLEVIKHNLRTRNIYRVRELLIENLTDFPEDKDFLMDCYGLAKQDSLIFQTHDHELLNPDLEKWDEENYSELVQKLSKNLSQMRYFIGIQLSLYFAEIKRKELEAELLLEQQQEEENEEIKARKRRKFKIKRPKRQRNDKERYTLAGIKVTSFLLVIMIAQVIHNAKR